MIINDSRIVLFGKKQSEIPIFMETIRRNFLNFVFNFKTIIDLLISIDIDNESFFNKWFRFTSFNEVRCISQFVKKFFIKKIFGYLFLSRIGTNLTCFSLIIGDWVKVIKNLTVVSENLKLAKNIKVLNDSFRIFSPNLDYDYLIKFINLPLISIIRSWIFNTKLSSLPGWFFIRISIRDKEYIVYKKVKLKRSGIPLFFNILRAKKIFITGLWSSYFFINNEDKMFFRPLFSNIGCFEDFIDYFGTKICKKAIEETIKLFFSLSIEMNRDLKFLKVVISKFLAYSPKFIHETSLLDLLKNIIGYDKNKISYFKKKDLLTKPDPYPLHKIHRNFLDTFRKVSSILIYIQKLEYKMFKFCFFQKKKLGMFEKYYFRKFFYLRMKFLSFIRTFNHIFQDKIFKAECSFFDKITHSSFCPILFLSECHKFNKKLHKIFFLNIKTRIIFIPLIKIFSPIFYFQSSFLSKNKTIYSKNTNGKSFGLIIHTKALKTHKLNRIKFKFESNLSAFIALIPACQKTTKIFLGFDFDYFNRKFFFF
nr:hypothetical protein 1634Bnrm3_p084 [Cryptomonas sp.]